MIAIGNDELRAPLPRTILCPRGCGAMHEVESSVPPKLQFYQCDGNSYLVGIEGFAIDIPREP